MLDVSVKAIDLRAGFGVEKGPKYYIMEELIFTDNLAQLLE